jgi:hypothetical protein
MKSESEYRDWEKSVVKHFFKAGTSNILQPPRDGSPLYATKNKVTVVLNFVDEMGTLDSQKVSSSKELPEKEYINLYHIGEKRINKTARGQNDGDFFYPAIDTGGLTNYKQKIGTKPNFLKHKYFIDPKRVTQKTILDVYKTWKKYSNKARFYGNILYGFSKAIRSIKTRCFVQFVKVQPETRVIYTSRDVYDKMGKYYIRLYGNKTTYAKEVKPRSGMFCGVTGSYVTPDLNHKNILNEYVT